MNGGQILPSGMAGGAANAVYSILVRSKVIILRLKRKTPADFWDLETRRHILTTIAFGEGVCILWAFCMPSSLKGFRPC